MHASVCKPIPIRSHSPTLNHTTTLCSAYRRIDRLSGAHYLVDIAAASQAAPGPVRFYRVHVDSGFGSGGKAATAMSAEELGGIGKRVSIVVPLAGRLDILTRFLAEYVGVSFASPSVALSLSVMLASALTRSCMYAEISTPCIWLALVNWPAASRATVVPSATNPSSSVGRSIIVLRQ